MRKCLYASGGGPSPLYCHSPRGHLLRRMEGPAKGKPTMLSAVHQKLTINDRQIFFKGIKDKVIKK